MFPSASTISRVFSVHGSVLHAGRPCVFSALVAWPIHQCLLVPAIPDCATMLADTEPASFDPPGGVKLHLWLISAFSASLAYFCFLHECIFPTHSRSSHSNQVTYRCRSETKHESLGHGQTSAHVSMMFKMQVNCE